MRSLFAALALFSAEVATAETYIQDIKPILDRHCVECHHAGGRLQDLSQFPFTGASDQSLLVERILAMTQSNGGPARMPPGNREKLTAPDASKIRGWLDSGLPAGVASPSSETTAPIAPIVTSPLPPMELAELKAHLPTIAYDRIMTIFSDPSTFWYNDHAMKPAYQAAVLESPPWGANSNDRWFNLIADSVEPIARNFYDEGKHNFRFPFGTTAGTDDSTNLRVYKFLSLPRKGDRLLPVAVGPRPRRMSNFSSLTMNSWGWIYPNGATLGELIFVVLPSGEWLPSEVRIRTRTPIGWSTNIFRPFVEAAALSAEIKERRPEWRNSASLRALVEHLDDESTLQAHRLSAPQLPGVFDQAGALDTLPGFGEEALVKELLTQTPFISAFGAVWKKNGNFETYAASTRAPISIVPTHYTAGLFAINDDSCMRCHKETGRHLQDFSPSFRDIVLYGEMWGRDAIFSFHPFEEARFPRFWYAGTRDNREFNPSLVSQGIITQWSTSTHRPPDYPSQEAGNP